MDSYGDYHIPWSHACEDSCNFHFGIDFDFPLPPSDGDDESEDVWSVEAGEITYVFPWEYDTGSRDIVQEWVIVVCEDQNAESGWCYAHIEPISGEFSEEQEVLFGIDPIATMAELQEVEEVDLVKHLHFMRSKAEYDLNNPGLLNPLAYLDPAPVASEDFTWDFFMGQPAGAQRYFFLPDVPAVDLDPEHQMLGGWLEEWPTVAAAQAAMFTDTDGNDGVVDVNGEVDFFAYIIGTGEGDCGGEPQCFTIMPRRMSWSLFFWDPGISDWRPVQEPDDTDFTRYVFDFGDIPIGGSEDWDEYKQLYFAYQPSEMWAGLWGTEVCLTNCSAAEDWDGIETIKEEGWNTALRSAGVDPSYHPLNMVTPDGLYRATVSAFDWELSPPTEYSIEFMLNNTKEIAQEVILSDAVTDQPVWHAEWVATYGQDGFVPVKEVYANLTAQPGSTLDIEIIFSGPMMQSLTPYVRFCRQEGDPLVAEPAVVEWTSTNLPAGYVDTWHGTVDVPEEGYSGWLTMQIKAKDISDLGLLDPSIADPEPPTGPSDDEYTDEHHGFGIAFEVEPGWPAELHDEVWSSPVLGDLDDDGDLDVAIQTGDGFVHLLDDDGSSMDPALWPMDMEWSYCNLSVQASPALADLDEDGDLDVLAMHPWGCFAVDWATGAALPGWVNGVHMGEGPYWGFYPSLSSPAVGDVDGDGHLEVVLCRHLASEWNLDPTVWLFEHTGGTKTWSRDLEVSLDGPSVISTAAIGDVSSSHAGMEIIVCTAEGFVFGNPPVDGPSDYSSSAVYVLDASGNNVVTPAYLDAWIWSSPVVADLDGDDDNEIIIGTGADGADRRKVLVLDGSTLDVERSWSVGGAVLGPVAVADLNDDGCPDVVAAASNGKIYAWSGEDYAALDGFPVGLTGYPAIGASVADIDGDLDVEIVVGTSEGLLYAINPDGSFCSGYPIDCADGILGQAAIGELDGDGSLEIVFADKSAPVAYCYDMGAGTFPAEMPWRQFQHDGWHSGFLEADNTAPQPPTSLDGTIEYTVFGGEVDLSWELSVNDAFSPDPQDPADVVGYVVWRSFPPGDPSQAGMARAGSGSFTDRFIAQGPVVRYVVTAWDGTNESVYSNDVRFHTHADQLVSAGCAVVEIRGDAPGSRVPDGWASATIPEAVVPAMGEQAVSGTDAESVGNPGCLTDGSLGEAYVPSAGAVAVVMDLGEECCVSAIVPETGATTTALENALRIEVAGADRCYSELPAGDLTETDIRYIRVCGAAGLCEVGAYGRRPETDQVLVQTVRRASSDAGWIIPVPDLAGGSAVDVRIFDLGGRLVWAGTGEPETDVCWNGLDGSGTPVPDGCYLVQYAAGSVVRGGRLIVTGE